MTTEELIELAGNKQIDVRVNRNTLHGNRPVFGGFNILGVRISEIEDGVVFIDNDDNFAGSFHLENISTVIESDWQYDEDKHSGKYIIVNYKE